MPVHAVRSVALAELLEHFIARGYHHVVLPSGGGIVRCTRCRGSFSLTSSLVDDVQLLVGHDIVVGALHCPRCGAASTIALDSSAPDQTTEHRCLVALVEPHVPETPATDR